MSDINTEGESKVVIQRFLQYLQQKNIAFVNLVKDPYDKSVECYSSFSLDNLDKHIVEIIQNSCNESKYKPFYIHYTCIDLQKWKTEMHNSLPSPKYSISNTDRRYQLAHSQFTKTISLSSTDEIHHHFLNCFNEVQQLTCKAIAKEFIRVFEPKKQTSHPYKFGDLSKPVWWPRSVPHKEPDHIFKEQRLWLLCTMMMRCFEDMVHFDLDVLRSSINGVSRNLLTPARVKVIDEIFYLVKEKRRFNRHERDEDMIEVSDFVKYKENILSIKRHLNIKAEAEADIDDVVNEYLDLDTLH